MTDNLDKKKYLAIILFLIVLFLALYTIWSKDSAPQSAEEKLPTATVVQPSGTPRPTATATLTVTPSAIPTLPPPTATSTQFPTPEPTASYIPLYGRMVLTTEMIEGLIHKFYIQMEEEITVEVREEEDGAVSIEGELPWVNVAGFIQHTGVITAAGIGEVAGYPDVTVLLTGTLTNNYFAGNLTMGTKGELPGGESGVYFVQGTYLFDQPTPTPLPTSVIVVGHPITETFEVFAVDFNAAMQTENIVWLYDHLHPAVFERYDPEECQAYLDRTIQPEFELKVMGLKGPESWTWELDGVAIDVDNAYTADSELTINGNVSQADVHFATVDGRFMWFTTCVNPDDN